MRAFDLLAVLDPSVVPAKCKMHLAMSNGSDDPLTLFRSGGFEEWQRWQSKRNFEREFVIAMIRMPSPSRWLFAGVYRVTGCNPVHGETRDGFIYDLDDLEACSEMRGRLVMEFERPGRQSYLNAEKWAPTVTLSEVLSEPLSLESFPGYKAVHISKLELDAIVRLGVESWRAALSSVGGVYLITDRATGRHYVGSAYGNGGIWQRWTQYSECGHGGNVELRDLIREHGLSRCESFHYSILEIADLATMPEAVIAREVHWKNVLSTREHGLNSN